MADLSSLSTITTTASGLSNLILVSPQHTIGYQPQNPFTSNGTPQVAPLPPSILFHYEGEQKLRLQSDITDHFIEDNSAIQDQITQRPVIFQTAGYIGELNDIVPPILAPLQTIAQKLTIIGGVAPQLSVTGILAFNEAVFLYNTAQQAVNSAVSTWSSLSGSGGENVISGAGLPSNIFNPTTGAVSNNQTKQQVALQQFYGYRASNTIFTIQTPWAVFTNMAIESIEVVQDGDTELVSVFNVSFKQMRFSQTQNTNAFQSQGRYDLQSSPNINSGLTQVGPSTGLVLSA